MIRRRGPQHIDVMSAPHVESQMTESGSSTVVDSGPRRSLDHEITRPEPPTATIGPLLEGLAAELREQPAPRLGSSIECTDTQFHVVDQSALAHLDIILHRPQAVPIRAAVVLWLGR